MLQNLWDCNGIHALMLRSQRVSSHDWRLPEYFGDVNASLLGVLGVCVFSVSIHRYSGPKCFKHQYLLSFNKIIIIFQYLSRIAKKCIACLCLVILLFIVQENIKMESLRIDWVHNKNKDITFSLIFTFASKIQSSANKYHFWNFPNWTHFMSSVILQPSIQMRAYLYDATVTCLKKKLMLTHISLKYLPLSLCFF